MERRSRSRMGIIDWRRVRAVSFDVGGTLIAPWPSVGDVYARAAHACGIQANPEILNRQFRAAWRRRRAFDHSRQAWRELVDQAFHGVCPTPIPATVFAAIFDDFGRASAWRIYPDVLATLSALQAHALDLALVSNWDQRLKPLLAELQLTAYFKVIVVSCEVGFTKPEAGIFGAAQAQLRLPAESILHLGDSFDEDVAGARQCGWQALHLQRDQQPQAPDSIASLDALLSC